MGVWPPPLCLFLLAAISHQPPAVGQGGWRIHCGKGRYAVEGCILWGINVQSSTGVFILGVRARGVVGDVGGLLKIAQALRTSSTSSTLASAGQADKSSSWRQWELSFLRTNKGASQTGFVQCGDQDSEATGNGDSENLISTGDDDIGPARLPRGGHITGWHWGVESATSKRSALVLR